MDEKNTPVETLTCGLCDKEFDGVKPAEGEDILCPECNAQLNGETSTTVEVEAVVSPSSVEVELDEEAPVSPPSAENGVSYSIQITAPALNVRQGPGTDNAVVKTLVKDKNVYTIVEEAEGPGASKWGKLKLGSGIGWISLDHAKKV